MASSCLVPGAWVEISEEEDEEIQRQQVGYLVSWINLLNSSHFSDHSTLNSI